jgi:hypothetical protein
MEQRRQGRAFLESGPWVPLEVAAPLCQSFQLLRGWLNAQQPVDPNVALVVHLNVLKLERLLLAGSREHQLVPVDQWQLAARRFQGLTTWLAATR